MYFAYVASYDPWSDFYSRQDVFELGNDMWSEVEFDWVVGKVASTLPHIFAQELGAVFEAPSPAR